MFAQREVPEVVLLKHVALVKLSQKLLLFGGIKIPYASHSIKTCSEYERNICFVNVLNISNNILMGCPLNELNNFRVWYLRLWVLLLLIIVTAAIVSSPLVMSEFIRLHESMWISFI